MRKLITTAVTAGLLLVPVAATTATAAPTHRAAVAQTPTLSFVERQAVREAESYLRIGGFSRSGLIHQLQYEGFSKTASSRAVDSLHINWNSQAKKSAKSYLRVSGFSFSGMVHQLRYEGFTASQARYGAHAVGL